MMPGKSGFEVLQTLRAAGDKTPVLLLTARGEVEDRIRGLDLGADDYLPKPFAMGELLARIRAMLRRREDFTPDLLTMGNLSLDRQSCTLRAGTRSLLLPKLEFQLMELLLLQEPEPQPWGRGLRERRQASQLQQALRPVRPEQRLRQRALQQVSLS